MPITYFYGYIRLTFVIAISFTLNIQFRVNLQSSKSSSNYRNSVVNLQLQKALPGK